MKKKILGGMVIAIAAVAAFNVNFNSQDNSLLEISLANIEALANDESGTGETCYNSITTKESHKVLYCGTCTYVYGTDSWFSGTGKC